MLLECLYGPTVNADVEPRLAAALPTISSDGLTYTIPLRRNATWSDGQPLTADDVLFTFSLILDPQFNSVPSGVRSDFRQVVASIQASDMYTVVFHLKSPDAPFPVRLLDVDIAPKHVLGALTPAQLQAAFAEPPRVVSGVWKVADWKKGDFIKYERNDAFYAGPALLDGYVYKVVPLTSSLVNQLKTGEVDVARVASPAAYEELKGAPSLAMVLATASFTHGYSYNVNPAKPASRLFSSKAVRQALLYALDREGMANSVFFKYAKVQDTALQPTSWAYSPPTLRYPYDPKKAAALLDADGWKPGSSGARAREGVALKFEIVTTAGVPDSAVMAAVMQQNWKDIGVEITIKDVPQASWFQNTRVDRDFDVIYNTYSTNIDPDQSTSFHSRNIAAGGGNASGYSNLQVDKLLDQAVATSDRPARKALYAQIQEILLDELPVAPMLTQQYAWAYNKRVHGMDEKEIGTFTIGGPRSNMNKVFVTK